MDQYKFFIITGAIFIFPVTRLIKNQIDKLNNKVVSSVYSVMQVVVMILMLVISILYAVAGGYNPFLYFNF